MGTNIQIYLLRHGETQWSKSGQHTGLTDIELTTKGQEEARLLGKHLQGVKFDHIFSSPLKRVRKTVELCGIDPHRVHFDNALLEWDYGDYEGLTTPQIHKKHPGWTIFSSDPPGGETAQQVEHRVDKLLAHILPLGGTIALFSSGHISRSIGARWLGMKVSFGKHLVLSTASKSILGFEHDARAILTWNDTSHLK